jgi:pilus assembly protein CpaB
MAVTAGKRRLILLGLALGMAGLAVFLVKVYLNRKAAELEAKYADRTEKVAVVVARKNVPAKTRVTPGDFAIRKIPADMAPPDAIAPADVERALGQSLKVGLPPGRPLLWGYLSSGATPSFSDLLETDRRALTIAVDELNSISGMIRPDDRIDLFIVSKEKSPLPGRRESKVVMPLLQDVLVKATGNIVRRETAADGREYDRRYSTLTLDLLPEEIGRVLIAQENGELKAALKRPEQDGAHYRPTRETDLWGMNEPEAVGEVDFVTFYIGGRGGSKGVLQSQIQAYPKDAVAGASRAGASGAGTEGSAEMEMIGGPMTREQIEQMERNMGQRRREAEAAETAEEADAAAPPGVSTASAGRRAQ